MTDEPDFDAPATGRRPPIRRRDDMTPSRPWGLLSALIVGGLLLTGLIGVALWLSLSPSAPKDGAAVRVAIAPAVPVPASPAPVAPEPPSAAEAPAAQAPAIEAPAEAPPAQEAARPPEPAIPAPPPSTAIPETRVPVPTIEGLAPVPDNALVERTAEGPLPKIGADGRKPWQVYARPFDAADKRPRIALIISGLGQSAAATEAAIQRLPGGITLAYTAYARNLQQWVELSRAAGHEVMLNLPMEPVGYPANDPGPYTLLTSLSEAENRARLNWLMSRMTGYVGLVNVMGSRFTVEAGPLQPVLGDLNKRGLLFVDSRASLSSVAGKMAGDMKLPRALNNRFIDTKAARDDIDRQLEELEKTARSEGVALGIGAPYPVTIERVARWALELNDKGIALAPVSAVVDRQKN
ncbi:MAG TPA: divergent polysaccharide deacetylase family protein [Alphaproteobacteria bacterium]|nr:divergent polysaccharide deacetylase family protein [Alphaproteobacteria bacterium]